MEHWTGPLHDLVVRFGYGGLFVVMFLGNLGVPVGTIFVMLTCGGLAANGFFAPVLGVPAWIAVGAVAAFAEVCGAAVQYAVGSAGGLALAHRWGKYIGIKETQIHRAQAFYERYGSTCVFLGRFPPVIRSLGSIPAGAARMPKVPFLVYTALGSAIFCLGLAFAGDTAIHNGDLLLLALRRNALAIAAVAALVVCVLAWRRRSVKRRLARAAPEADAA